LRENGGPTAAAGEAAADHLLLDRKVGVERKEEARRKKGLTLVNIAHQSPKIVWCD
jgi:hypothetical protein